MGVKAAWSGYLVDKDELPMPLSRLEIFTSFRKAVEYADVISKPCHRVKVFRPCSNEPLAEGLEECLDLEVFAVFEKIQKMLNLPVKYDLAEVQLDPRSVLDFKGGESAALARLEHYCTIGKLDRYKQTRNGMVGGDYSTKLSAWLALGCISARTIYHRIKEFECSTGIANEDTYWVVFELLWRDYMRYYALKYGTKLFKLYGPVGISAKNKYRWAKDKDLLEAWCTGKGLVFVKILLV